MSAAGEVSSVVQFPNQQFIIDYISRHPIKANGIDSQYMTSNFPDSLSKIAQYFARKKMSLGEIKKNILTALQGEEESRKLSDLQQGLQKLVLSCEQRDAKGQPSSFTMDMKGILSKIEASEKTSIAVSIYHDALSDLLEGATYTPPNPGEDTWKRHVAVLSHQ